MSKKTILILAILVLALLVLGAGIYGTNFREKSLSAPQNGEQKLEVQLSRACEIFTLEKAKELLGPEAVKSDQANNTSSSYSEDIATSSCVYTDKQYSVSDPPEKQTIASLIVRSPRNDMGKSANENVFLKGALPSGANKITGYGASAFWNTEFGQLNILESGEWYILDYGSFLPSARKQADAERFAGLLL